MSSTIRPARRAAQLAAIRINEICKIDNSNSDSDESTTIVSDPGIIRARDMGYENSLFVVRYLLNEFDTAKFEDERSEIATKMFKFLNDNPAILIHEPNFRDTVLKKIDDITLLIDTKNTLYKKAQYSNAIKMMKMSMLGNVRNSKMRTDIYKHLNEISYILDDYSVWSNRIELRNEMNMLYNTILKITTRSSTGSVLN
jgi:hypothetical protein